MKYQYSYSRIDRFNKCPQAFKFYAIDKLPEKRSSALVIGGLAHELIAEYNKHLITNNRQSDPEKIMGLLNAKITDCSEPEFAELADIINEFAGSHFIDFSFQSDFMIEKQLAFNQDWQQVDWMAPDVFFRGVIDNLHWEQDLLVITDYKTNHQIDPPSVIDNSLQLKIYSWLAHLLYPEAENIFIRLDYVRHSTYRKLEHPLEMEQILEVPDIIMKHVERIEKEEKFKPKISSLCDWCGFQANCDYIKNIIKTQPEMVLQSDQDALKLATDIRAMESFIKQGKDRLKSWVEMNRALEVGDESLDFHPYEEKSFADPIAVVQALQNLGMENGQIWPIVNIAQTKVKSAMKKAGVTNGWEDIEKLMTNETKTRFGFKKIKE